MLYQDTFVSCRPWEPRMFFSPASSRHVDCKRTDVLCIAWVTLREMLTVLSQPLVLQEKVAFRYFHWKSSGGLHPNIPTTGTTMARPRAWTQQGKVGRGKHKLHTGFRIQKTKRKMPDKYKNNSRTDIAVILIKKNAINDEEKGQACYTASERIYMA